MWQLSNRADTPSRLIADRHYNRQKVGTPQFVPPGRCVVLLADGALWVTSYPFAKYVRHAWAGAWVNSCFRKECGGIASEFIRDAIAATRAYAETDEKWGDIPTLGIITFVDSEKVRGTAMRRHKCACNCEQRTVFGYCYERAGFTHAGFTKGGLWAWQLLPNEMPDAIAPLGFQARLTA